jgi:hypothetical protein
MKASFENEELTNDQHVARSVLHHALGNGTEEHTGFEIVSAPADDEQRGPRIAGDLDQRCRRVAGQGDRLEPYSLSKRSQTGTSQVQEFGGVNPRSQERLREQPTRVDLRLDRNDEQSR